MRTSWTLWGHWWLWWPIEDYLRNWVLWGHVEDFQNILRTLRPFWGHFEKLLRTFWGSVQDLSWNCGSEKLWTLSCFWGLSRNLGTLRTFRGSEDLLRTCGIWEYFGDVLRTLMTFWGYEDFVDPLKTLRNLRTISGSFEHLRSWGLWGPFEDILSIFWGLLEDLFRNFLGNVDLRICRLWFVFDDFLGLWGHWQRFEDLSTYWAPGEFENILKTFWWL